MIEKLAGALEPRVVGRDQLFAAVRTLLNETRALEHRDVLLHGGEAHVVARSEIGHRRRFGERPLENVAARAVGEGAEQLVERCFGFSATYNHMVVYKARPPTAQGPLPQAGTTIDPAGAVGTAYPAMTPVDESAPPAPAPPAAKSPFALFFRQLSRRGRAGAADYIYQILIVIIGVYLGITFEAMVSDRDRIGHAHATLTYLLADMKRDDADMTRVLEAQRSQARDYAEIAAWLGSPQTGRSARIDSLLWKVTTNPTVYPRRGVYASMIAAGQIALLDEDLSSSIINLYEHVYTRLAANGEHYDLTLESEYFPAYSRTWDPIRDQLLTADAVERVRFHNTVRIMEEWSRYYTDLIAQGQAELRTVLAKIDR